MLYIVHDTDNLPNSSELDMTIQRTAINLTNVRGAFTETLPI
jgi:hypothetical protein